MAVCAESDITGQDVAGFGHQLMADAVGAVDMFDAVFGGKGVALCEMTGIVQLAGGNEMVIDQDHSVGIPDFGKAHFLELFRDKGDENIVYHDAVDIDGNDLAGRYLFTADIVRDDFFNKGHSHIRHLLSHRTPCRFRSDAAWPLPDRPPRGCQGGSGAAGRSDRSCPYR